MAGDTGHYHRKPNDRRDSFKQQNRKNSVGRQKENAQRSSSASPSVPKGATMISAHHDHSLSERERPEKYSSGESAWGVKGEVQSVWGESKGMKV
ncbi:hypothetical protein Unana1_06648 [Umbelopsis nana]